MLAVFCHSEVFSSASFLKAEATSLQAALAKAEQMLVNTKAELDEGKREAKGKKKRHTVTANCQFLAAAGYGVTLLPTNELYFCQKHSL